MADVLQNVQLSTGRLIQVVALADQNGNQLSNTAGVTASDGVTLPPGLAQAFGRDSSYNIVTITQVFNGNTYVKTLTRNAAGLVTNISQWVKQ